MINMSTVNSIRQQSRDGFSISNIAKRNGVSRDAISTSPKTTSPRGRPPSAFDRYRPLIESRLNEDERNWRESTPTSLTLGGGNVWTGTASKSAIIVFHLDFLTYPEIPSKCSVLLLAITISPSLQRETAT